MRRINLLFTALLIGGVLSQLSLADDPSSPADAKAVAAPAPATPPAGAPATAPPATSEAPSDEAFERYVRNFKVREKDGQKVYCRTEASLGTRLAKTVCLSENRVREEMVAAQTVRDSLNKARVSPCSDGRVSC